MKQLEIDRFWQTRPLWENFGLRGRFGRILIGEGGSDRHVTVDSCKDGTGGRLHVVTSTNDSAALRDPRRV